MRTFVLHLLFWGKLQKSYPNLHVRIPAWVKVMPISRYASMPLFSCQKVQQSAVLLSVETRHLIAIELWAHCPVISAKENLLFTLRWSLFQPDARAPEGMLRVRWRDLSACQPVLPEILLKMTPNWPILLISAYNNRAFIFLRRTHFISEPRPGVFDSCQKPHMSMSEWLTVTRSFSLGSAHGLLAIYHLSSKTTW